MLHILENIALSLCFLLLLVFVLVMLPLVFFVIDPIRERIITRHNMRRLRRRIRHMSDVLAPRLPDAAVLFFLVSLAVFVVRS